MELADLVYDINANPLKMRHTNATIYNFSRDTTIEIMMYMITVIEDEPELVIGAGQEVNATKLAELACDVIDLHDGAGDIPEDLFEIAGAIAAEYDTPHGVENTD